MLTESYFARFQVLGSLPAARINLVLVSLLTLAKGKGTTYIYALMDRKCTSSPFHH
jgi:hypothetical protein